jgi:hypothetical protein
MRDLLFFIRFYSRSPAQSASHAPGSMTEWSIQDVGEDLASAPLVGVVFHPG